MGEVEDVDEHSMHNQLKGQPNQADWSKLVIVALDYSENEEYPSQF